ncbi:Hypothetical_protein [Hexamita inflata]|uniref:Hypothetical_protein n=1 Tax=Hexamita inflata TaxID=28002 RepID=A0AA86QU56_9EUKA|nr:Hypothetical protein HINF_LOCUS49196 [Hexamita inflata]
MYTKSIELKALYHQQLDKEYKVLIKDQLDTLAPVSGQISIFVISVAYPQEIASNIANYKQCLLIDCKKPLQPQLLNSNNNRLVVFNIILDDFNLETVLNHYRDPEIYLVQNAGPELTYDYLMSCFARKFGGYSRIPKFHLEFTNIRLEPSLNKKLVHNICAQNDLPQFSDIMDLMRWMRSPSTSWNCKDVNFWAENEDSDSENDNQNQKMKQMIQNNVEKPERVLYKQAQEIANTIVNQLKNVTNEVSFIDIWKLLLTKETKFVEDKLILHLNSEIFNMMVSKCMQCDLTNLNKQKLNKLHQQLPVSFDAKKPNKKIALVKQLIQAIVELFTEEQITMINKQQENNANGEKIYDVASFYHAIHQNFKHRVSLQELFRKFCTHYCEHQQATYEEILKVFKSILDEISEIQGISVTTHGVMGEW